MNSTYIIQIKDATESYIPGIESPSVRQEILGNSYELFKQEDTYFARRIQDESITQSPDYIGKLLYANNHNVQIDIGDQQELTFWRRDETQPLRLIHGKKLLEALLLEEEVVQRDVA